MKFLNTLFFFFIYSYIVTAQNITIVYEAITHHVPEEIRANLPEHSNRNIIYKYVLSIKDGISKYSRNSVFIVNNPPLNGQEYWYYLDIYKDYNNDVWIEDSGQYQDNYALKRSISNLVTNNSHNWTITDEKKNIAGIECIKAMKRQGYVAWYAPSIPYPDGPQYGVFGLPGTILEYETPQHRWTATEVLFHEIDNIVLPERKFVSDKSDISISYNNLKKLSSDRLIVIKDDTPWNVWLTFDTKN